jgi:hypothetical protein
MWQLVGGKKQTPSPKGKKTAFDLIEKIVMKT